MIKHFGTAIALFVLFLGSTIGVVDGANLIANPGFESGTTSWNFYTSGGGTFTTPSPGYEDTKSAKLALTSSGTNIQLFQTGVALEANTRYRLSFAAYSNTGHDMTIRLFKHGAPYTSYMADFTVNIGTTWQTFSTEFTSSPSSMNDGRLMFWLAPFVVAGDSYYIDAIILEKVVVGGDSSPPIVTGSTPTGTNVPVSTQITVTFNESMNQSSAQSAFSTSPATSGSFTWSGNVMTYTPGTALLAGTVYTFTIGTGAKDLAGNFLQVLYSSQFTTASVSDTSPPIVIGSTPTGTGIPVTTQISVTFNESMNTSSAQTAFSTSPATSGTFSWSGNVMTYTPGSSLSASTTYTVTIGTGAKDLAGNNLQSPYSWSFTTSGGSSSIEARLAALEAENTALRTLLAGVSRNGNNIYIDGANLHIRDGSGDTYGPVNGLGNLIIGYNEFRGSMDNRTGSHNLVLGTENNYRSYGGFVAGTHNEVLSPYSSIIGGLYNIASGWFSSVTGGNGNTARGSHSSVTGGYNNTASGDDSSVTGGTNNTASGNYTSVSGGSSNIASDALVGRFSDPNKHRVWSAASISGGYGNTASGEYSSVSGGLDNRADGSYSSVSGGDGNTATEWYSANGWAAPSTASSVSGGSGNIAFGRSSSVSGGSGNIAYGRSSSVSGGVNNAADAESGSSVSGGYGNNALGEYSSVSGGVRNTASGYYSSVSGGESNTASGQSSSVIGGYWNKASNFYSSVSGGQYNKANGTASSVSGGQYNTASGSSSSASGGEHNAASGISSSVSGGIWNTASGEHSSISGGESNTASGLSSSVSGGYNNTASGGDSSVSGGYYRSVTGDYDWRAGTYFSDS